MGRPRNRTCFPTPLHCENTKNHPNSKLHSVPPPTVHLCRGPYCRQVASFHESRTLPHWHRHSTTIQHTHMPIELTTVGSRVFPVAAAQVWNSLPEAVIPSSSPQSFRRQLKTHLFQQSHPHLIL